jgi:hypothetical protein
MAIPTATINNRRFLILGERPKYRTLALENNRDRSVLIELDIQSIEYLSEEISKQLVEPILIQYVAPVSAVTLIPSSFSMQKFKPYWRILLRDEFENEQEKLISDRVQVQEINQFLSKPSWNKKDYWKANALRYVLETRCSLTLKIFPKIYERYSRTKHKHLLKKQRCKK